METAEIKTVIENLMEQYRYSVDAENKHHHAEAIDWNGDTELPSYESAKELLKELESYASHPSPMSASDMTAREYFDGEGSPLTLSKICNDEEKEFLLQHIELYASGKVHQSKQPPMSAEQVQELGYYYPLFKFFSDEHGLSLLDSQLQDVIHECKKFIEPSTTGESWKAEYDNCRALLQELVSLKVMRENLYKGNPDGKEYAERKPKAWQAAQQFLLTYQHEGFATTPSVKADGWVSVEDELPKVGQKVDLWLVPDDEEKSYRMTWTWEKESTARITINGCKVTHWQPFTPPKQHLQTITSK